jgi:lysophospholipase L1-like esterase
MRPYQTVLFLLLVFVLGLGTAAIWPKDGLPITRDWRIPFVSLDDLFGSDTTRQVNVDSLLASYEVEFDSTAILDSLRLAQIAYRQQMMRIQYADSSKKLERFFAALDRRKQGVGKVRILHYGDSQIEGDRMTSDIRNGFQKEFGGSGPGHIDAYPLASSLSISNNRSANWRRLPVFGNQDSTLNHNRFGMYGVFARFTPFPRMDTLRQDSIRTKINDARGKRDTVFLPDPIVKKILPYDSVVKAWVVLSPTKIGYLTSRKFTKMSILFRNPDAPFKMRVVLSDSTKTVKDFPVNGNSQIYNQTFVSSPEVVRLEFQAKSSPDIYSIRLENDYGIVMDNIPMRGSSGTYFGKINNAEMASQFASTNPDLIVLQFGGNTVPYMTDEKVANYGKWFSSQIQYLQRMNPNADFVLIGPSDMSIKEGTKYITFPILPSVRDVLRTAALDNGIGFWDMYEVMGGRNSMPSWVNADPPLAAPDYVHFSRQGARKLAELFYDALMKDYEEWKSGK